MGKFVRTYSAQTKQVEAVRLIIQSQYKDEPLTGAVACMVTYYMKIPESYSNKKKTSLLFQPHTKKPDLDNLDKFINDCMNGIVWKDDSQVASSHTRKIYSDDPRTVIEVRKL
jgi:Holliday junction resolvase RusA-like endonuclease